MIIKDNDPMIPLDKYGNYQKMVNPYGTFQTHVPEGNTVANRQFNEYINKHHRYPQQLLKEAYSNLHPRQGVTVSMNYQIRNMKRQQIERYANEAGKYLAQIHDTDKMTLTPENIWNLPDISNPKNKEYWKTKDGRSHISPDDFLDLHGKSDQHLQWDANYWQGKSIGDQNNKKQVRHDNDSQHELHWYNYYANKYNYYSTYPFLNRDKRDVLKQRAFTHMTHWQNEFNNNYRQGSKSWLAKINVAQGYLKYHQNLLHWYQYYYPDMRTRHGLVLRPRVIRQEKQVANWQKKLQQDIQHKNQDYTYYQKYLQQYRQNKYNEMMDQHWQEIHQQVAENQANSFTSIYRADGMDTRVVRVAEISPTEDTSMNVPTKSIDDGMPQNDFTSISQSQLSGQYTIYLPDDHPISPNDMDYGSASPSYNDRVAQYRILKHWAEEGKLLAIEGFNSWHSILISDVSRTADQQSSANGMQMNITFQYARLAHIKYAKNKQAPARPMRGRHQSSNRGLRVKAHDTFWGYALKYGGTVGEWEHANPHAVARDLQIGSRINKPSEAK